jgi:hypothetical protein
MSFVDTAVAEFIALWLDTTTHNIENIGPSLGLLLRHRTEIDYIPLSNLHGVIVYLLTTYIWENAFVISRIGFSEPV